MTRRGYVRLDLTAKSFVGTDKREKRAKVLWCSLRFHGDLVPCSCILNSDHLPYLIVAWATHVDRSVLVISLLTRNTSGSRAKLDRGRCNKQVTPNSFYDDHGSR